MAYISDKKDPIDTPQAAEAVAAVRQGFTLSLEQIGHLPAGEKDKLFDKCCFAYEVQTNSYRCPAGRRMTHQKKTVSRDREGQLERLIFSTERGVCAGYPLASRCCKNAATGRQINRSEFEPSRERMRERMDSDKGKAHYKMRGETVEPKIGYIKDTLSVRRFSRRGLEKVRIELDWVCATVNIGILLRC